MNASPAAPLRVVITGGEGTLAQALRKEFSQAGDEVHSPGRGEMDVRDEARVAAYFMKLDRLDALIINAGLTRDGTMTTLADADFAEVIEANLRGAFLSAQAALKLMLPQKSGHIIMIGSRAARSGPKGQSAYAAAKAGLVGLAQSVAKEYGARNIRCNIVLPGFLETRMTTSLSDPRREAVRAEHVLGRFNTVGNAAQFIAFLTRMDHVSGQIFTLDSRMDRWT